MNNRAEQDFTDSKINAPESKLVQPRQPKLPALYATQVAGQQNLEPLYATDDEDAVKIAKQRVCAGQLRIIYIFKLMSAEAYEPSSRTVSVEEMKEMRETFLAEEKAASEGES